MAWPYSCPRWPFPSGDSTIPAGTAGGSWTTCVPRLPPEGQPGCKPIWLQPEAGDRLTARRLPSTPSLSGSPPPTARAVRTTRLHVNGDVGAGQLLPDMSFQVIAQRVRLAD